MPEKKPEALIKIKYTRSDIRGLGPDVRLHPCDRDATENTATTRAYNEISLALWRKFEKHPQIAGLVADGSIVVLAPEKAEATVEKVPESVPERKPRAKKPDATPAPIEKPPALPEDSEAAQALKNLGLA